MNGIEKEFWLVITWW